MSHAPCVNFSQNMSGFCLLPRQLTNACGCVTIKPFGGWSGLNMRYDFLIDTYDTERIKVLSVWSMFTDADLSWRPPDPLKRGRSVLEQMVHQCVSEDFWFKSMLGIDLAAPPLPESENETRLEFMRIYADRAGRRLERLRASDDAWFEQETQFFE